MLHGADVLVFTHTGNTACKCPPIIPGFSSVSCAPRTHDPTNGGVAIYAKSSIAQHVQIVVDRPEYGLLWVCMDGIKGVHKALYVAACYMPPVSSSYYKRDSILSMQAHFDALTHDICEYRAKGEVLILGDINARTALGADFHDEFAEWKDLEALGVPIPDEVEHMNIIMQHIPMRQNQDQGACNALGQRLLQLCREQSMIILNGRLPGDQHGSYTFHADGRQGRSAIDYCIASPELVFMPDGVVKCDSFMHVWQRDECPKRPDGGNFDHVPVLLAVGIDDSGMMPETKPDSHAHESYRWRDDAQGEYVNILRNSMTVDEHFQKMCDASLSVDDLEAEFTKAIRVAVHELHNKVGKIIRNNAPPTYNTAPKNSWYSAACKEARQRVRRAENLFGRGSEESLVQQRVYKRVKRDAKRAWVKKDMCIMRDAAHHDPKRFWRTYNGGKKPGPLTDIEPWTSYFTKLYGLATQGQPNPALAKDVAMLFPEPSEQQIKQAACLNDVVTGDEIHAVLTELKRGKSPGVDGISAEFLKYASWYSIDGQHHNALSVPLMLLFNRVLREGYPHHWSTATLAPVPKPKGRADVRDDYRGIAVSSALSKVFSMLIMRRMDSWAESNGVRAQGQAGFRMGRSTIDNAFVLNHIIDKFVASRPHPKPLYTAFIDFQKAYDRIDRDLLWRCFEGLGVHGDALEMLKQMYSSVALQVRINGALGTPFESKMGVKQGDPLSPLLFGIFIDKVESFFREKCPAVGVKVLGKLVQVLLYADDLVLMAESPEELQQLLDCLSDFCTACSMKVNVRKSEVVVFHSKLCTHDERVQASDLCFEGNKLVMKDAFIYLGIVFTDGRPIKHAMTRNLAKSKIAAHMLFRRCYSMGIHNVHMQLHLFDSLVRPVMNYGCELWAPYAMSVKGVANGGGEAEVWHLSVLRQSLGVRKSVPTPILMRELGRNPLYISWLKQTLGFWNNICCRADDDLVKMSLQESLDFGMAGQRNGWVFKLNVALRHMGCDMILSMDKLDVDLYQSKARDSWNNLHYKDLGNSCQVRDINDYEHKGFKLITHNKWFAPDKWDLKKSFVYHLFDHEQIRAVAQFRMGVHWLNIEILRMLKGAHVARSMRTCLCCPCNAREDEMHIFECACYNDIRRRYQKIFAIDFSDDSSVYNDEQARYLMNGDGSCEFWETFANFILKCKKRREDLLELN